MATQLRLSYIYADAQIWEKLEQIGVLGWPRKTFLQQVCAAYLKAHNEYYAAMAAVDAAARGLNESDYYRVLQADGELPAYHSGDRPSFNPSPLAAVAAIPQTAETRRRYNLIDLSDYNATVMKAALIIEGETLSQFVSRILVQHFAKYWESTYQPQFVLDQKKVFTWSAA